jgi:MSHA biogenesis protein MshP
MSLVVAIFLVVVIALLAAFAVTMGTATSQTTNLQLQADRAFAAARAGTEWGAYRALVQNDCQSPYPTLLLDQGALRGFQVIVDCTRINHGAGREVVDITATASWGNYGSPEHAYRSIVSRHSN